MLLLLISLDPSFVKVWLASRVKVVVRQLWLRSKLATASTLMK